MITPTDDWPGRAAARVRLACVWEATARKVGNVHPGRAFADTAHADFVTSGHAAAAAFRHALSAPDPTVGRLVLAAVTATRAAVRANTNLGIVLLLAPLALARTGVALADVLAGLTVADAELVYAAIRLAAPGGLGDAPEQDARNTPTVTLLEAMTLAADRDAVARQYASGYADVLGPGAAALADGFARFGCVEAAIVHCQLALMAAAPDTLIARKCGRAEADRVREMARGVLARGGLTTPAGRAAGVEFDEYLRADGNRRNPGATADVVTAVLFAALAAGTLPASTPFPWHAPDWL